MPWFKVDDGFHSHPKVASGLPLRARGLWVTAGSWSADALTDGFVPLGMLRVWSAKPSDAASLVDAGLWHVVGDPEGWQFHDWSEYQPTAEQVRAEREASKRRVTEWRERRRNGDVTALHGRTYAVSNADVTVPPTRPDPTRNYSPPETHSPRAAGPVDNVPLPDRPGLRVCPSHQDVTLSRNGVCISCEADKKAATA